MSFRKQILDRVDALASEIIGISRFIHANPETGFKEVRASEYLMARLSEHGFRVEKPIKKMPTAFVASKKSGRKGPAIGFISEYDALPGIGHGCGHNLIAASGFGAATALEPVLESLGGSIWLFGTPAEENGNGKVPMVRAGLFDHLDAVFLMHPESVYMVNTSCLALDSVTVRFAGKSSHAACTPWEGVNALDAMVLFFNAVGLLRQQLRPDARVHGIITKGGSAPNMIPDFTEAEFFIRAQRRAYLNTITRKIQNCAKAAALATGCKCQFLQSDTPLDDMVNNQELAALVESNLKGLGVKELAPFDEAAGSSDVGNVSHRVPALYFYGATAPKGMDVHTREFARASAEPRAHRVLLLTVKAMALSALELLENPQRLKKVREAFVRSLRKS